MKRTPISDWLTQTGISQQELAAMTGVTQTAISKMVRSGREIYVVIDDKKLYLEETRKIGSAAMVRSGREIYVVIDDKKLYLEETRKIGSAA